MNTLANGLALIFDLDGVIIDSMPMHRSAWQNYLARLGVEIEDIDERMHGRRNDEIVAEFIGRGLTPQEVFTHGAAKETLFREMMRPQLIRHLVPGIAEFLERYRTVPTGLATNAEPANADFILDGVGLRERFRVVVDGHQVQRPKPFPDIYLRAAGLLAVAPENCIIFEDSPTGIAAGRAAGSRVVGVGTHAGIDPEHLRRVDLFIRDFLDPALEPWLHKLEPVASRGPDNSPLPYSRDFT